MRNIALAAMLFALPANAETSFHFYGAENCPPCMAFKRNHLSEVQAKGQSEGFKVFENVTARTADVPVIGIFGDADPILRKALATDNRIPYPPIFFVTRDDEVLSFHGTNWSDAMHSAAAKANSLK